MELMKDRKIQHFIGGDFNLDFMDANNTKGNYVIDLMLDFNLTAEHKHETRIDARLNSATMIDAIFGPERNIVARGLLLTCVSDHLTVLCEIKNMKKSKKLPKFTKNRDMGITNINNARREMDRIDWNKLIDMDTNKAYDEFISIFTNILNDKCPVKTKKFNPKYDKYQPFMTDGLMKSKRTKDYLLERNRRCKTNERTEYIKLYIGIYNSTLKLSESWYYNEMYDANYRNPRKLWSLTKDNLGISRLQDEIPTTLMGENKEVIKGDKKIADAFNKHFVNIGPSLSSKIAKNDDFLKYMPFQINKTFTLNEVNDLEIGNILKNMLPKLSTGPDGISNKILKLFSTQITKPLTIVTNKSFKEGIFPTQLKRAKIVALMKSGNQKDPNNYRPISLLNTCSKVIEKAVQKRMEKHFDNIISDRQFGFRKKHSCTDCITAFLNTISGAFRNKGKRKLLHRVAVFLDLRKAFDTINHSILLKKLEIYGFDNTSLKWMTSYLTNRYQITHVRDSTSDQLLVRCGVPQGSILGPCLFIIYINDMIRSTSLQTFLFADDTTVYIEHHCMNTLERLLNFELSRLSQWFKANLLVTHPKKTVYMKFFKDNKERELNIELDGHKLERVGSYGTKETSVKFLGIFVDDKLTWEEHISKLRNKLRSQIYLLSTIKRKYPLKLKLLLYRGIFVPHLLYGISIWGHGKGWQGIEKLNKWCLRTVLNLKYNSHTSKYFKANNLLTFTDLRDSTILIKLREFIEKITPNFYNNMLTYHPEKNRKTHVFNVPFPDAITTKFPQYIFPRTWNNENFSTSDIQPNAKKFKTFIKKRMISKYSITCTKKRCYVCRK